MADNQVDLTGKPAEAWRYLTKASTLGRSYALKAWREVVREDGRGLGWWLGQRENRQSLAPLRSHQLVRIGFPIGLKTVTVRRVKVTVQSASQKVPMPRRGCEKGGRLDKISLAEAVEVWTWPVAVSTRIDGAEAFRLVQGAEGVR